MTLPLEILDRKEYGTFDRSQLELIANEDAYDLVLIENEESKLLIGVRTVNLYRISLAC
uniref:Uncharacterized protein n=1 Tax=Marseillevirus LCMAC201 TaxID=2506605 RepID=A0A481YX54_9VIRU|nr:MAG: hypothetical protein LCMAC201_05230 [Marseillevirus LCMAC201]